MVELKTAAEIDAMAAAGAVAAEALPAVAAHARPGMPTAELDRVAADVLARHGASSRVRRSRITTHRGFRAHPLCTATGGRAAHAEDTVAITGDGARILTG